MLAVEVNKDNVSLQSKGRVDLFASLPKIKISYIPGYSVVRQINSMCSHPLDHSSLPHGPWDLESKANSLEQKPEAIHCITSNKFFCLQTTSLMSSAPEMKLWESNFFA